jgi:hypothetical protein
MLLGREQTVCQRERGGVQGHNPLENSKLWRDVKSEFASDHQQILPTLGSFCTTIRNLLATPEKATMATNGPAATF